MQSFAMA